MRRMNQRKRLVNRVGMVKENSLISDTYQDLLKYYGRQPWWPADDPFEVMVGAILTQNTSWSNVEKAIANMKQREVCDPQMLVDIDVVELAGMIRSSGYFNQKAQRLVRFSDWYLRQGGYDSLQQMQTDALRQELLDLNGIGNETADDILLYAFDRPCFVIDAYTRRLFSRLGLTPQTDRYPAWQQIFQQALVPDVDLYQQYHALVVAHAKQHCLKKPLCPGCPLAPSCQFEEYEQSV